MNFDTWTHLQQNTKLMTSNFSICCKDSFKVTNKKSSTLQTLTRYEKCEVRRWQYIAYSYQGLLIILASTVLLNYIGWVLSYLRGPRNFKLILEIAQDQINFSMIAAIIIVINLAPWVLSYLLDKWQRILRMRLSSPCNNSN